MKQAERSGQRRWTRHEYVRLIDHGLLNEDDPIELLDGLVKEQPIEQLESGGLAEQPVVDGARIRGGSSDVGRTVPLASWADTLFLEESRHAGREAVKDFLARQGVRLRQFPQTNRGPVGVHAAPQNRRPTRASPQWRSIRGACRWVHHRVLNGQDFNNQLGATSRKGSMVRAQRSVEMEGEHRRERHIAAAVEADLAGDESRCSCSPPPCLLLAAYRIGRGGSGTGSPRSSMRVIRLCRGRTKVGERLLWRRAGAKRPEIGPRIWVGHVVDHPDIRSIRTSGEGVIVARFFMAPRCVPDIIPRRRIQLIDQADAVAGVRRWQFIVPRKTSSSGRVVHVADDEVPGGPGALREPCAR